MKHLGTLSEALSIVTRESLSLTTVQGSLSLCVSGVAVSTITAGNIVSMLASTPVNRATADASGNNIAATYVTAVGVSGNYLTWTKNGVANSLTVPYATNAGSLGGIAAADYLLRRRIANPDTYSTEVGKTPFNVFAYKGSGKPIYTDPEFASGKNSVATYNNSTSTGTVTITRGTYSSFNLNNSGNSSGYVLKITAYGSPTPGNGGFFQTIDSKSNGVFVQIFRALIPTGYSLQTESNSMGASYQDKWITDNVGTGKWEWYGRIVHCGNSGTFSSGGHVSLNGTKGTEANPLVWYLSYCNVIDITSGNYDGLRTRLSDSADTAAKLTNARTIWGQTFDGTANVNGNFTTNGTITMNGTTKRIYFGTHYLELTADGYLHTDVGFYSDSFVSSGGIGQSVGGGAGTVTAVSINGTAYSPASGSTVVNLGSGYAKSSDISSLSSRVATLESGAVVNLSQAGSGDFVKSVTKSGTTVTVTKGGVAWTDISSRPAKLSAFTDDVVSGHYLPLSGGNITGSISAASFNSVKLSNITEQGHHGLSITYQYDSIESHKVGITVWDSVLTLGEASTKNVDSDNITSTSSNSYLPTSKAVVNYLSNKYIPYGDALMPTNSFGGKRLYINSIDNAFASADKKYYVTVTIHSISANGKEYPYIDTTKAVTDDNYFVDSPILSTVSNTHSIFDGSYEGGISVPEGQYLKIRIMFGSSTSPSASTSYFNGYPYGSFYLSYFYVGTPLKASQCRIYNKFASSTLGWKLFNAAPFAGTIGGSGYIERIVDESDYQRTCVEFIIFGSPQRSGYSTTISDIDYSLSRPNFSKDGSTVTKFGDQNLYNAFRWYDNHVATISINPNGSLTGVKSITMSGAISGATSGAFSSNVTIGGTLGVTGTTALSDTLTVSKLGTFNEGVVIKGGSSVAPLILKGGAGAYRQGLRIMATNSWSDILLAGSDAAEASGTSANSWFIGNNNGNFYITRNGSTSSSSAMLSCVSNAWSLSGNVSVGGTLTSNGINIGSGCLAMSKTNGQLDIANDSEWGGVKIWKAVTLGSTINGYELSTAESPYFKISRSFTGTDGQVHSAYIATNTSRTLGNACEAAKDTATISNPTSDSYLPTSKAVVSYLTSNYAKLASPTFTGTPKAPTAAAGTNSTQIATTAFVQAAVAAGGGGGGTSAAFFRNIKVFVRDGELYVSGHQGLAALGYVPYLFRHCKKRNRLGQHGESMDHDMDRKGWMRFGGIKTTRVDENTGLVTWEHPNPSFATVYRGDDDSYPHNHSTDPKSLFTVSNGIHGESVRWGKSLVRLCPEGSPRRLVFHWALAFGLPNQRHRDGLTCPAIITNLAEFTIVFSPIEGMDRDNYFATGVITLGR